MSKSCCSSLSLSQESGMPKKVEYGICSGHGKAAGTCVQGGEAELFLGFVL